MKKRDVPKQILEKVEEELLAGENLLWVGLPGSKWFHDAGKRNMKAVTGVLLGLLVMGQLAFLLMSRSVGATTMPWIVLTLIGMLAIVAGMVFFMQRSSGANLYAITNRRAIIMKRNRVQSFAPEDLHFIERKMYNDGTGDIIFQREYFQRTTLVGTVPAQTRETQSVGFFGIENPAAVEALMLETFRSDDDDFAHLEDEYLDYEDELLHAAQS